MNGLCGSLPAIEPPALAYVPVPVPPMIACSGEVGLEPLQIRQRWLKPEKLSRIQPAAPEPAVVAAPPAAMLVKVAVELAVPPIWPPLSVKYKPVIA